MFVNAHVETGIICEKLPSEEKRIHFPLGFHKRFSSPASGYQNLQIGGFSCDQFRHENIFWMNTLAQKMKN